MAAESRNAEQAVAGQPSRRGRPPGEVTPESLLKLELIAHLKLYRRMREMVEANLETASDDPDLLAKYMDLLRKGIADLAKPFVAAAKPESAKPAEEEDGEKILARLLGGEGTR